MVLAHDAIEHRRFADLPAYVRSGDVLVLNETRVIAARLLGRRASGGQAELLLLHPSHGRYDPGARRWIALARPARRLRCGDRVAFADLGEAEVVSELPEGLREVDFTLKVAFESFLERAGRVPLPPYVRKAPPDAAARYQTVFARLPGSVAAPTASLHFTSELLAAVQARGVEIVRLSLDVGLGTFRPVTAARASDHVMHAETYTLPETTVAAAERAKREGRRVIAAGTTVVRALEGNAAQYGRLTAGEHRTDAFIRPGFPFRVVDALITNFHLPRSTLLMLVSAFAGRERIARAYDEAVRERYRFFSFGDAMLVV